MEGFKVVKRDGKLVDFDFNRVVLALNNAYEDCYGEDFRYEFDVEIEDVLDNIYDEISGDEQKPKKKKTHKKGKLSHNKKGKEGSLPKNVFEKSTKSFSEKEDL